jgi:hypothetical protein
MITKTHESNGFATAPTAATRQRNAGVKCGLAALVAVGVLAAAAPATSYASGDGAQLSPTYAESGGGGGGG